MGCDIVWFVQNFDIGCEIVWSVQDFDMGCDICVYRKINNTILYIKVHNIQQKLKKRKSTDSYIMSYIRVQSLQLMWGIVNNQQSHIYHIPCQNPAQIKQSHILCQNSAQIKQYHIPLRCEIVWYVQDFDMGCEIV
jgi:hypothetical protein